MNNDSGTLRESAATGKILLVDDDAIRRDFVRAMLKSSPSLEIEGVDCRNAILLVDSRRFDLILIDVTLPDRSGLQVLDYLKKNQIAARVIVLMGKADDETAIRSETPGTWDYVTKPYNRQYLLKCIEHVLSNRHPKDLKLQIIKAGDFIKSTPTGNLDLKTSLQGLAQIASTGSELDGYTVLIDLRDIKSQLSTVEIFKLASELDQYGETFRRKTAILARADGDIDQAAFFEDVAQNRGFRVRAFTVFEDALFWLSSSTQRTEDQSGGNPPASPHRQESAAVPASEVRVVRDAVTNMKRN